jgi:hypothetical protein
MAQDIESRVLDALDAGIEAERPPAWTPDHVGRMLVKAFMTLDRLPHARGPRQPGGHWPGHVIEWADQLASAELDESERRDREQARNRVTVRPTAVEIRQMDTAFDWLRELRDADPGMALVASLWALRSARGRSVKKLIAEKKWAPHTFYRKRAKALEFLATRLDARGVPVF